MFWLRNKKLSLNYPQYSLLTGALAIPQGKCLSDIILMRGHNMFVRGINRNYSQLSSQHHLILTFVKLN